MLSFCLTKQKLNIFFCPIHCFIITLPTQTKTKTDMNLKSTSRSLMPIMLSILFLMTALIASGQSKSFSVFLYRCSLEETGHKVEPLEERHRSASMPIVCMISKEEGVSIPQISSSDILKYEIYDDAGDFVISFGNQEDFIDFVFHSSETIIICLVLEDYALVGYVYQDA